MNYDLRKIQGPWFYEKLIANSQTKKKKTIEDWGVPKKEIESGGVVKPIHHKEVSNGNKVQNIKD